MGILDRLEREYLDVSSRRSTLRDLLELVVGAVFFVLVAWVLTSWVLGPTAALVVAGILSVVFLITIISQTYWGVTGRSDYRD